MKNDSGTRGLDMTEGNPLSLILRFAVPLLLGTLFQQTYNIADAAIVGRFLGHRALAAVGASSSVQFLVLGFCEGLCVGFSVPVAQMFGGKKYDFMRQFVFNAAVITAVLGAVITGLCTIFCDGILFILSTPSDIYKDAYSYLLIIFFGIPSMLMYNLLAAFLRAIGDSRTPFIILVVSTILNVILDVAFIIIFKAGCSGTALATVISQVISGLLCLLYIISRCGVLRLKKPDMYYDGKKVKLLLSMGVPMGLQYSITAIGSMVMQSANNALGSVYVSAFTAGTKIKQFAISPFNSLAAAVATFAGQNYGAGRYKRIHEGFWKGTGAGILLGIFTGTVLILFGRTLSMMFIPASEVEILDAAGKYLFIGGFFYPVISFLNCSRLTVQGLGYSNRAIYSGVMEMIARISVSVFCVPVMGYTAICFCDQAAWVCATCYIFPYCLHLLKKISSCKG